MQELIYFDNAATTKVSKTVLDAMLPYLEQFYFNPSSIYSAANSSKKAIEKARGQVASAIGAQPSEIYFTSCASESNNWAFNIAKKQKTVHFITTKIEHASVLKTAKHQEREHQVTFLDVDDEGRISLCDLERNITNHTKLVSIMYANNETGVVQPIAEAAEICAKNGILFHTDAVQAVGKLPIDVKKQKIGMLSLSGHKFHAPKGIGALYVSKEIRVSNFLFGGEQEHGKRSGTENVANIVAIGCAIEEAMACRQTENENSLKLKELLFNGIMQIPKVKFNGCRNHSLPNILNFSFEGVEGEGILLHLDLNGIYCSSGSACTSGSLDPSHVLTAMGLDHATAQGSVRISLSKYNTEQEVCRFLRVLTPIIAKLRSISPIWQGM